jgi:hypothetical protein
MLALGLRHTPDALDAGQTADSSPGGYTEQHGSMGRDDSGTHKNVYEIAGQGNGLVEQGGDMEEDDISILQYQVMVSVMVSIQHARAAVALCDGWSCH